MSQQTFPDRATAGRDLAAQLRRHVTEAPVNPLVLALPRGGLPVAAEIARELGGELDVAIVRKIGAPGQPEFGVGAVAEDGPPVFDTRSLGYLGITEADLYSTVEKERAEVARRIQHYREGRPISRVRDRAVIVVDDGVATGVTARAALRWLREHQPRRLVFAAPVCSPSAHDVLSGQADAVVCLSTPTDFQAVGQFYVDFAQLTDEQVLRILAHAREQVADR
ncbi:phosphoribosyltransferase [Plantactinospora sp. GCM10030261]|uniref:phosphoribosyltransferase n=1 Tax=Plantactinospora sp. GCM10030261 TaxID=3273420 RepID=UPI003620E859